MLHKILNVAVVGASGYTGAELVRLLLGHPNVILKALVAHSNAGKRMSEIYPHLTLQTSNLPLLQTLEEVDFETIDVAFCCLPHGASQETISKLHQEYAKLVIIDLSADFRLFNLESYKTWYGHEHHAPKIQSEAVYGLAEHKKTDIQHARVIANPGCYPTSILLPLLPLLNANLIQPYGIIADSKSGITGAGRDAKVANLFAEANEDVRPYSIGGHRHVAEIEQELSIAAKENLTITFTPQVVPMNRGIVSVLYVQTEAGVDVLKSCLHDEYRHAPFVHMIDAMPTAKIVRGTNHAVMNVFADRVQGRVVIISAIDNLVKGASGQALQNMNIRFGLDENVGLGNMLPLGF